MDVFSGRARRHESTRSASLFALEHPGRGVRQPARDVRAAPADLAPVLAGAGDADRRRHAAAVRPLGAARSRARRSSTYEQCVDWVCDALEPLGDEYVETVRRGCLEERWIDVYPEPGEDGRRVLGGRAGDAPVHRDELRRHGSEPRHARARARPLDALVPRVEDAAADLGPLLAVRRRGRIELPPGAPARPSARRRRRPEPRARDPRGGDGELPSLLLHHADARALRARDARARRAGRGAHRRPARGADGRPLRRGVRAGLRVRPRAGRDHLGAVLAPVRAVLRLPVRDGDLRRARARARRARRARTVRPSATSTSCPPAARSTRSTSCGRRAST